MLKLQTHVIYYSPPGKRMAKYLNASYWRGEKTFNHPCALQSWRREMMFSFFKISIIHTVPNICNWLVEAFRTTVCCIAFLQKVRMVLKGFKEFSTELSWEPPTYPFCKIKTSFWKKRGKIKLMRSGRKKEMIKNNAPSDRAEPRLKYVGKMPSLYLCVIFGTDFQIWAFFR